VAVISWVDVRALLDSAGDLGKAWYLQTPIVVTVFSASIVSNMCFLLRRLAPCTRIAVLVTYTLQALLSLSFVFAGTLLMFISSVCEAGELDSSVLVSAKTLFEKLHGHGSLGNIAASFEVDTYCSTEGHESASSSSTRIIIANALAAWSQIAMLVYLTASISERRFEDQTKIASQFQSAPVALALERLDRTENGNATAHFQRPETAIAGKLEEGRAANACNDQQVRTESKRNTIEPSEYGNATRAKKDHTDNLNSKHSSASTTASERPPTANPRLMLERINETDMLRNGLLPASRGGPPSELSTPASSARNSLSSETPLINAARDEADTSERRRSHRPPRPEDTSHDKGRRNSRRPKDELEGTQVDGETRDKRKSRQSSRQSMRDPDKDRDEADKRKSRRGGTENDMERRRLLLEAGSSNDSTSNVSRHSENQDVFEKLTAESLKRHRDSEARKMRTSSRHKKETETRKSRVEKDGDGDNGEDTRERRRDVDQRRSESPRFDSDRLRRASHEERRRADLEEPRRSKSANVDRRSKRVAEEDRDRDRDRRSRRELDNLATREKARRPPPDGAGDEGALKPRDDDSRRGTSESRDSVADLVGKFEAESGARDIPDRRTRTRPSRSQLEAPAIGSTRERRSGSRRSSGRMI